MNIGDGREECTSFLDGHSQNFINGLAAITDFQGFTVVTLTLADVAMDKDVRQKMHFDFNDTVTRTGFTTATFDIKTKAPWCITA